MPRLAQGKDIREVESSREAKSISSEQTFVTDNVFPSTRSEDREYFNFESAELQKEISEIL